MIKSLSAKIFDFKRPMNLLQLPGVSLDCQRDFTHYLSSLLRMELWALQSKKIIISPFKRKKKLPFLVVYMFSV